MKRVLKWTVPVVGGTPTEIGAGQVMLVQCQHTELEVMIWTLEDDDDPPKIEVRVFGTGESLPDGARHIGSTVGSPRLVWHVFAVNEMPGKPLGSLFADEATKAKHGMD